LQKNFHNSYYALARLQLYTDVVVPGIRFPRKLKMHISQEAKDAQTPRKKRTPNEDLGEMLTYP